MFNTVLILYGIICDDVGWWSGFKKVGNSIYDVEIGLHRTVEGMGINNQVDPTHGYPIGSSIILVDVGRIM